MELKILKVEDIKPYENNPRKNTKAVAPVVESIKQCGYIAPIIVDENNVIIAGHTRWKALRQLDTEECQVLVVDGLTDEEKKKYRFLDNKTGEKAVWDVIKLYEELEGLDLQGFDFFRETEKATRDTEAMNDAIEGCQELDIENYSDEKYKYECPKCGFRFN